MVENNEILEDLLLWADSIRKKDEQLQKKKPIRDEALPPIRKSAKLVIDQFSKPVGLEYLKKNKTAVKRAPTAASPSSNDSNKKSQKAREEKEKGNAAFQKQKYQEAISHYDLAVQYGQQSPPEICAVYYTNRAMAYLKISKFKEAEQDCTNALVLHPKNLKAAWRRGVARRGLGRLDDARQDFEMALKIEPGNKVVLEELKKLPPKESKHAGLSSRSTPKTETKPASPKKPSVSISKSPAEEQKEKDQRKGVERRRLSIKVVDEAYSDVTTTSTTSTTTTPAVDNKATTAATPPLPSLVSISTTTTPSSKMDTNPKPRTVNEQSTKKNIGIQEINNGGNKPVSTVVNPTDTTPKLPPIKFNVPKTNLEFERDWKTCRHRGIDVLYQYFQSIPPSSYPTLFRSSLDSDQFEQMLDLLDSHYAKYKTEKEIYNVLEALSQVRRIDMLVMFLGNNHKQVLQRLYTRMKDKIDQGALLKIAKTYGVK